MNLVVKKENQLEFDLNEGTIFHEDDDHDKEVILNQLKEIINKLSPREREIVYLKYFQNFNNTEISELLDINYQTVRNILGNAIKKLRKLGENYIEFLFLLFSK
ncbi:sigma-70 family RNA polymerase sigma factor [Flavobacterium sp. Arc2]|uniref:sigma-70 family RNA polymerase sigma factor n=1 Tax=Flavobacterium sp. Arc2 TaxID=3046685 RepID=UPI00352C7D7F